MPATTAGHRYRDRVGAAIRERDVGVHRISQISMTEGWGSSTLHYTRGQRQRGLNHLIETCSFNKPETSHLPGIRSVGSASVRAMDWRRRKLWRQRKRNNAVLYVSERDRWKAGMDAMSVGFLISASCACEWVACRRCNPTRTRCQNHATRCIPAWYPKSPICPLSSAPQMRAGVVMKREGQVT